MSDVLHHARYTPTQLNAINHHARFTANIEARAQAIKPAPVIIPIVAVEPPQPVPVQRRMSASELEEKIAYFAQELKELRRINSALSRQEFANANGHPAVKNIQRAICAHYNITMIDIQSGRRNMSIVFPRQLAMYLAKTMTLLSLPQIGRKFGGRDHTTVLHAVRKITNMIATDEKLAAEIAAIKVSLRPACSQPVEGAPCNSTPIPNLS